MVGPQNFDDDPLRLLKAIRMAVRLGFGIDEPTIDAIRARAGAVVRSAPERISYELSVILSAGAFREAVGLLHRTRLDIVLFGRELDPAAYQADDLSLAAAYAIVVADPKTFAKRWRWSESLLREVATLRRLIDAHDPIALHDAGEEIARQLPALVRALGGPPVVIPDDLFRIRALLTGEEISALTGLNPGPELGRRKRALVEAQIRGEVRSREEAERFVK
jgi:hypothetical protein